MRWQREETAHKNRHFASAGVCGTMVRHVVSYLRSLQEKCRFKCTMPSYKAAKCFRSDLRAFVPLLGVHCSAIQWTHLIINKSKKILLVEISAC